MRPNRRRKGVNQLTTTSEASPVVDEIAAYHEGNGLWTVELIGTANSKRATITLKGVNIELVSEIGEPITLRGIVDGSGTSF